MALDVDLLLDRRRLKRRLIIWRSLAIIAAVIAVLAALRGAGVVHAGARIGRVSVSGIITEDRDRLAAIRDASRDPAIRALIVAINSPGGSVAGGEALYRAISGFGEKKPVVAVMGGMAASAGYMIALPASRVFARETTITGSIGVLMETGEVSGLLDKIGVTAEAISSGPLKDQPSFVRPLTSEGRDALRVIVMDMYDQFVSMVANGRHMQPDAVRTLADGRAYTGRQALKLGLIDAIGDEQDARDWLESAKGLPKRLPIEELSTSGLASRVIAGEFSPVIDILWKSLISQSVMLDQPWALWHR
jgi:protease-4